LQACRTATAVTLLVACGSMLAGPAAAGAASPAQPAMLGKVNAVRAAHGLGPLRASPALHRSARRYARWMLRHDYFGHLKRIRASSRFGLLGENLAWHSGRRPRIGRTIRAWLGSPGHRALLVHPRFRFLGAGMARGTMGARRATAWVLHFGG
jgi:uncharacterized protein YkwD